MSISRTKDPFGATVLTTGSIDTIVDATAGRAHNPNSNTTHNALVLTCPPHTERCRTPFPQHHYTRTPTRSRALGARRQAARYHRQIENIYEPVAVDVGARIETGLPRTLAE